MLRKSYFLDRERLLFRQVKRNFREKLSIFSLVFVLSVLLAVGYGAAFKSIFGSPKEHRLQAEIDELQNRYALLEKEFTAIDSRLSDMASSEDLMYRPVLDMETVPGSFRQSGYGGSRKYDELEGYANSKILISANRHLNDIIRRTYVQSKSFEEIIPKASDWRNKMEHIPYVRPVKVNIPLGDGVKFREVHPVLGGPRWHYGQDFSAPIGTKVYATGSGIVLKAAWTPYGFGNRIEIDHGYGFHTIYGHLSGFNVKPGQKVKRGDLIGYSGDTGISTGPHLHYEIHLYGRVQNPLYFFDDDLTLDEYFDMIQTLEGDTIN